MRKVSLNKQKFSNVLAKIIAITLFTSTLKVAALDIGQSAPDFTLKSTQGINLKLAEQRGQIIVINFWASWCGPCRKEMPVLQTFHSKYKSLGVFVWGVNVEQENQAGRDFLADRCRRTRGKGLGKSRRNGPDSASLGRSERGRIP